MLQRVTLGVCMLALLAAPAAIAQDQQMVAVLNVNVMPGHQQGYEAALKELWKGFKQAGVDKPIFVSTSVPARYSFAVLHSSFADLDSWFAKSNAGFAAAGSATSKLQQALTSTDWEMWAARPDLSYTPDSPRVPDSEQRFTQIVTLYPHAGKVAAFEEAFKEGAALRKKAGSHDGTAVFQLAFGANGPAYAILLGAKDQVDYYTQNAKLQEKMGDAWGAYLAKIGPLLRDVQMDSYNNRPDLAYQP